MANQKWRSMVVNQCFIVARTSKSVLLRMPSKSDFDGYEFWHPAACFREKAGTFATEFRMSYKDDWTFRLQANGGAIRINLTADQFEQSLHRSMDIFEPVSELHEPIPMEPISNPTPLEELIDDED